MRDREDKRVRSCSPRTTAHLYAHIEQGRVFPITYNVGEVLDGYETLRRLVRRGTMWFRGMTRSCCSAIRRRVRHGGWIARLDIEPRHRDN